LSERGATTGGGRKLYTVPNGQYVVQMSVLKALGDDANPAPWETWT
jgi:minor extracellular serine protease Vpr